MMNLLFETTMQLVLILGYDYKPMLFINPVRRSFIPLYCYNYLKHQNSRTTNHKWERKKRATPFFIHSSGLFAYIIQFDTTVKCSILADQLLRDPCNIGTYLDKLYYSFCFIIYVAKYIFECRAQVYSREKLYGKPWHTKYWNIKNNSINTFYIACQLTSVL